MTQKWAAGELSRDALMGWGVEHYHWISNLPPVNFYRWRSAPPTCARRLLDNYLRGARPRATPPADRAALRRGQRREPRGGAARARAADHRGLGGLPHPRRAATSLDGRRGGHQHRHRVAVAAAIQHGAARAAREVPLRRVTPSSTSGCTARPTSSTAAAPSRCWSATAPRAELQEKAIHWARESARMRWFYFDGIYLHYELGYKLR